MAEDIQCCYLSFSAKELKRRDVMSRSDTFCVVSVSDLKATVPWVEVFRTEVKE